MQVGLSESLTLIQNIRHSTGTSAAPSQHYGVQCRGQAWGALLITPSAAALVILRNRRVGTAHTCKLRNLSFPSRQVPVQ